MAVVYCNGGASGGIEKVVDETGKTWFDARATKVLKIAGWSQLLHIAGRWAGIKEVTPYVSYGGCTTYSPSQH